MRSSGAFLTASNEVNSDQAPVIVIGSTSLASVGANGIVAVAELLPSPAAWAVTLDEDATVAAARSAFTASVKNTLK